MASKRIPDLPEWLWKCLDVAPVAEGEVFRTRELEFTVRCGIPRAAVLLSQAQAQTSEAFGFKWQMRSSFESPAALARAKAWLIERYGEVATAPWLAEHGEHPLLVDAGCGAAMAALELLGPILPNLRYLGVDVSEAVDVAQERFAERNLKAAFLQCDLGQLPLAAESVDLILSEGVLHHTDSTELALKSLARLLKRGGRFLFYVYRRKGPVREFTDDHIRGQIQHLSPEQAWKKMEPLTRLGISLGELDCEIEIPESIELLGIPAGRINVQRFFYWHFAKAFYRPDLSFDEMNHINYDWYAPKNAHRQSPEEVRAWCADAGLVIERERIEEAGITIVAQKR